MVFSIGKQTADYVTSNMQLWLVSLFLSRQKCNAKQIVVPISSMKLGPVVFQIETLIGYNVPVFTDPSLNPFPPLSIIGNVFVPPRKKVQFGSKIS